MTQTTPPRAHVRVAGLFALAMTLVSLLPSAASAQVTTKDELISLRSEVAALEARYEADPTEANKLALVEAAAALEAYERQPAPPKPQGRVSGAAPLAPAFAAPTNDNLASADPIFYSPFTAIATNVGATAEPGEVSSSCEFLLGSNDRSVWWTFTPTTSGQVTIDTYGSLIDTVLGVWTGTGHPLTEVACDDDDGPVLLSTVTLPVAGGTTYFIRVEGWGPAEGHIQLNLTANSEVSFGSKGSGDLGGPPPAFTSIATPDNDLGFGDDDSQNVPVGFPFPFYGVVYNDIPVSSNGYLNPPGDDPEDWTPTCPIVDPVAGDPNGIIAPLWADFNPNVQGSVHAESFAVCPTGSYSTGACFVVEWNDVPIFGGFGHNTFQVILYPDGVIEFQYFSVDAAGSMGVENQAGSAGVELGCGGPAPQVAAPAAFIIFPDADGDGVVGDGDDDGDGLPDAKVNAIRGLELTAPVCRMPEAARIEAAIQLVTESLNPLRWIDTGTLELDPNLGRSVFDLEYGAFELLDEAMDMVAGLPPGGCRYGIRQVQRLLVSADREIAHRTLLRTQASCVAGACLPLLDKAEDLFEDAERWRVGENYKVAIDKYGDAWEAMQATVEAILLPPGMTGSGTIGVDGTDPLATATETGADLPTEVVLSANYPNPFNPATTIRFGIPEATDVTLSVYDVMGREIARLADGRLAAGFHEVIFDAGIRPSGVYVYRLVADGTVRTGRMLLVK